VQRIYVSKFNVTIILSKNLLDALRCTFLSHMLLSFHGLPVKMIPSWAENCSWCLAKPSHLETWTKSAPGAWTAAATVKHHHNNVKYTKSKYVNYHFSSFCSLQQLQTTRKRKKIVKQQYSIYLNLVPSQLRIRPRLAHKEYYIKVSQNGKQNSTSKKMRTIR